MWELVKITGKLPDDPFYEEMNPVMKLWMFHNWVQDQVDKNDFAKSFSIFLGSFFNPEAAQKMLEDDKISSSEEAFEESTRWITEGIPYRNNNNNQPDKKERKRAKKRRLRNKIL